MGRLVTLSCNGAGGTGFQPVKKRPKEIAMSQMKWDAGVAVLAIVGAQMKYATLAFRFVLDVAAAWFDAGHQIAVAWREK